MGYGHSLATQMVIKNCTQCGIEWSRGTSGHCDLVTLQANVVGLDIFHNARCHVYKNAFTSNTTAIRARSGGYYYDNLTGGGNVYTGNTTNWLNYAASGETDADLMVSPTERRRGFSLNSYTHTGTTAKTTLLSPWTIPANFFTDQTKKIRVKVHGEFTTAGGATKIGVAFDGVDMDQSTAVAPVANAKFVYDLEIWAVNGTTQYKSATLYQYGASIIQQQNSPAQIMNAPRNVNITLQLANAAHTARIFATELWVTG